jgi:hypothetical protein
MELATGSTAKARNLTLLGYAALCDLAHRTEILCILGAHRMEILPLGIIIQKSLHGTHPTLSAYGLQASISPTGATCRPTLLIPLKARNFPCQSMLIADFGDPGFGSKRYQT